MKNVVSSFDEQIMSLFAKIRDEMDEEYLSGKFTITLCKRCHFLFEVIEVKLCQKCKTNYHDSSFLLCDDCIPKNREPYQHSVCRYVVFKYQVMKKEYGVITQNLSA